jgi:hypothetical protein
MTDKVWPTNEMLCACLAGFIVLVSSPAFGDQTCACTPTESSAKRLTVFISDLHMGVGKDPNTKNWNAMEDFRWGEEFSLFLEKIHSLGGGKTDLVILGDLFELWQFVKDDCDYNDPNLGCTEDDALKRVRGVLEAHGPEMEMLKKFADSSSGENRVHIVPGNHDAALLYNKVAQEVIKKINAAPGKVCILSEGYWRSSDGLIYADHGHQIEDADPNSYKEKWPKPFTDEIGGKKYLIRVWGERFVQKYYNPIEEDFPIIDNLSAETLGIKYGVAARGFLLPHDIVNLCKFVFLQVSEDQLIAVIRGLYLKPGEQTGGAKWNVKEIRRTNNQQFVSDLSTMMEKLALRGNINKIALKKLTDEGKTDIKPSDLSDDEIIALCNLRAALLGDMSRNNLAVSVQNCPTTEPGTLGIQKLLWGEDVVFRKHLQEYLEKTREALPSIGGEKPMFNVYIYGHTHAAHAGSKYKGIEIPGYWPPQVFNSGTWVRVADEKELSKLAQDMNLSKSEVLPRIPVEKLPARYSFVMIKPYEETPIAELRYWLLDSTKAWKISKTPEEDQRTSTAWHGLKQVAPD